ncbi:MAG: hypothetical protein M1840_002585 [Geoglossum simile]|nr:MAG: hypothetical protein M1840_002585 [Geoglossum simile]
MKQPQFINKWPDTDEIANKVPTAVAYRAGNMANTSWGFGCPPPNKIARSMAVKDLFKLYLDPAVLERVFRDAREYAPGTIDDVRMWFRDFLRELYGYIWEYLDAQFRDDWRTSAVEYIFSVPTTWNDPAVVEDFRKIVRAAGFGENKRHSVTIGLTEAEAAAAYTAKNVASQKEANDPNADLTFNPKSAVMGASISEGHTLLVCDSGGGTTDICVLKVVSVKKIEERGKEDESEITELEQLDFIEGEAIGSIEIDEAFEKEVNRRLELIRSLLAFPLPEYAAQQMTKGPFQDIKSVFGSPLGGDLDSNLRVPGLPQDFDHEGAKIKGGRMIFTQVGGAKRQEISELFDKQIRRIFGVIDRQRKRLQSRKPFEQVSHFVLSGGLCSSNYVQRQVTSRYGKGGKILISDDPQLAVCKGLVIDRVHRLKYGQSILFTRCCRASYGILFNEPYDKKKHAIQKDMKPLKGPLDGKEYAIDQIHWLVRQGQPIKRDEPIKHTFYRIIDSKDSSKCWKDTIAMSRSPPTRLPNYIREGDAHRVCVLKSSLDSQVLSPGANGVKAGRRHWMGFRVGKSYLKIEHEFVVSVGPADLKFEIRFAGEVINKAAIPVQWMYIPSGGVGRGGTTTSGDEGETSEDEEAESGGGGDEVGWQRGLVLGG